MSRPEIIAEAKQLLISAIRFLDTGIDKTGEASVWRLVEAAGILAREIPAERPIQGRDSPTPSGFTLLLSPGPPDVKPGDLNILDQFAYVPDFGGGQDAVPESVWGEGIEGLLAGAIEPGDEGAPDAGNENGLEGPGGPIEPEAAQDDPDLGGGHGALREDQERGEGA